MDLDLLLKSRFIVFQDSFILPLHFETLVAKYCRLSFVLRLLTLFLKVVLHTLQTMFEKNF